MRKFFGAKKKRQAASLLLAAVLAVGSVSGTGTLPVNAEEPAATYTGGLCEHHTAHDKKCGYQEAVEGSPCTHEHTDDCYTLECKHKEHDEACGFSDDGGECSHEHTEDCYILNCSHTHDEACGYQEAVAEEPCGYVCEICSAGTVSDPTESETECICEILCTEDNRNTGCPVCGLEDGDLTLCQGSEAEASLSADGEQTSVEKVQALIDALPTVGQLKAMSLEEQQTVYANLQTAYDAYETLSDEEKQEVTGAEIFDTLFAVFNGMTDTLADSGGFTVEGGMVNTDYTLSNNTLTINTSMPLTISAGTEDNPITGQIVIAEGVNANLMLNGVYIVGEQYNYNNGINSTAESAIKLSANSILTLTLADSSNNTIVGGSGDDSSTNISEYAAPGIHVPQDATLIVLCAAAGDNSSHICDSSASSCGKLTIQGGSSQISIGGVGIGGGVPTKISGGCTGQPCGTVMLLGGDVTVTGAAGYIGFSDDAKDIGGSNAFGDGSSGAGGIIIILTSVQNSSGTLNIGAGISYSGGMVDNGAGIKPSTGDNTYEVYGNLTLPDNLTIPAGVTLTIPENTTLTVPSNKTLTNYGTIVNNGTITVDSDGTIANNGDVSDSGSLTNNGIVNRKQQAATAPTANDVTTTENSVTVRTVAGQKYALTGTQTAPGTDAADTWKDATGDSLTFDNLTAGTTYYLWTYMPAGNTDYYTDSAVSLALAVTMQGEAPIVMTYQVTVEGGSGGGQYKAGDTVTIKATVPDDKVFTGWKVTEGNVTLADASKTTTTFTMPAEAVTVEANYEDSSTESKPTPTPTPELTETPKPHTHSYISFRMKAATCTEAGTLTHTCSCGQGYSEEIPALGHNYTGSITKQPTVTSEGVMTYTCTRCGDTYTKPIEKLKPQEPTETPKPGPGVPFIRDDDGKESWEVIRDGLKELVEKVRNGETTPGERVVVDMNGSTSVPAEIFAAIAGEDVTVVFDMGNGITWTVNGKSVTGTDIGDIDFGVTRGTGTIPVDVINNVTGERYSINITLAYEGEFGFTAILTINLDQKNAGLYANLFYYHAAENELEYLCADQIDEEGNAELTFTHASDYTIVIDAEPMEPEGAEDSEEPTDEGTIQETAQTNADDQRMVEAPQSGETARWWWILLIVCIIAAAGIGGYVYFVGKKKGR